MDREQFLNVVRNYVASDPGAAPYVTQAASAGVDDALREAVNRASDMEVALAVAISRRYKGADALIYDKDEPYTATALKGVMQNVENATKPDHDA